MYLFILINKMVFSESQKHSVLDYIRHLIIKKMMNKILLKARNHYLITNFFKYINTKLNSSWLNYPVLGE